MYIVIRELRKIKNINNYFFFYSKCIYLISEKSIVTIKNRKTKTNKLDLYDNKLLN